ETLTVNITGKNDVATFTGDSTGSVKEESALTFSGKLVATDVDHDETGFQAASDVAGTYGKLSIDAEGKWTYTLDNTNKDVQALGENSKPLTDTVKVQSFDGTEAAITVTINGTNDDATITGTNSGDVAEDGTATTGATLTVSDIDTGENVVSVPENLNGTYGSFKLAADGTWSYDLANSSAAVQGLQGGEKVTDTLTVKSADGTATETLTVNITGKNDVATFTGKDTGGVTEDTTLTATGKLNVADADNGEATFKAASDVAGTYGKLSIATDGNWTYTLDNTKTVVQSLAAGATAVDKIKLASFDGTEHTIEVTVTGINDVAVIGGIKAGAVTEDNATNTAAGTLTITDVDTNEAFFTAQTATKGTYGSLTVGADGKWAYALDNSLPAVNALKGGEVKQDTFNVTSKDGLTTDKVVITVTGANDAPTITLTSGSATSTVAENSVATEIAKIVVADVDGTAQAAVLGGADASKFSFVNGTLTLNANVDYEALPANDKILDVTLTATDSSNASIKTTQAFAVTISNASETYSIASSGAVKTVDNFDESGSVIDKLSIAKSTMSASPALGTLGSGAYQEINNNNNASSFSIQDNKGVIEFKGPALAFAGEKLSDDAGQNASNLFDALRKDSSNPFNFSLDHIDTQNGWKGYIVAYQDGDAFVYYGNSSANSFGWDTELKANEVKLVGIVKGVVEGSLDASHFTVV
ncbi:VCBS domain-containing protein, partial [Rhizobium rhizoryzae]|uniref:VCBS domain-containing protein n=1 Tax=Rhizobium rhizoryzae TaxID=451876 RepID=UPI00289ABBC8